MTTTISTSTSTNHSNSNSTNRRAIKRILTELSHYKNSLPTTTPSSSQNNNNSKFISPCIDDVAPTSSENLLHLSAILSGRSLPQESGYSNGRWLLEIHIPPTYPIMPPRIRFVTRICHANVNWETGDVCLDVLQERWTPVLGIVGALESIGRLLVESGADSPLGIEVAALERMGDLIGKRSLVEFWCNEERWEGGLEMMNENS